MKKVDIEKKFELFQEYWCPKILGEVNDHYVKIFKAKGELVWHDHKNEDEFFLVIKGQLKIRLRDQEITLNPGQFFIVPRGVEHLPYAEEETHVLLFEPKNVVNTGDVVSEQTVETPEWI